MLKLTKTITLVPTNHFFSLYVKQFLMYNNHAVLHRINNLQEKNRLSDRRLLNS